LDAVIRDEEQLKEYFSRDGGKEGVRSDNVRHLTKSKLNLTVILKLVMKCFHTNSLPLPLETEELFIGFLVQNSE
jgi:hypothetical protein